MLDWLAGPDFPTAPTGHQKSALQEALDVHISTLLHGQPPGMPPPGLAGMPFTPSPIPPTPSGLDYEWSKLQARLHLIFDFEGKLDTFWLAMTEPTFDELRQYRFRGSSQLQRHRLETEYGSLKVVIHDDAAPRALTLLRVYDYP